MTKRTESTTAPSYAESLEAIEEKDRGAFRGCKATGCDGDPLTIQTDGDIVRYRNLQHARRWRPAHRARRPGVLAEHADLDLDGVIRLHGILTDGRAYDTSFAVGDQIDFRPAYMRPVVGTLMDVDGRHVVFTGRDGRKNTIRVYEFSRTHLSARLFGNTK